MLAMMPKLQTFTHNGLLLCRLFIVLVAECIQGLVLLGNQWPLFVELRGFVNNGFLCPRVHACRQMSPQKFRSCVDVFFCWCF